jgi:hypothetical protein
LRAATGRAFRTDFLITKDPMSARRASAAPVSRAAFAAMEAVRAHGGISRAPGADLPAKTGLTTTTTRKTTF